MTRRLVAVVGQTASGKSDLALILAEKFGGEIVCADSRQFYRGMDVGTAKPTTAERARVPHHLFDIADPSRTVGLGQFLRLATEAINAVWASNRVPFVVGGTGQYLWALLEGWEVPEVEPLVAWREQMEQRGRIEGPGRLYVELQTIDPEAARRIQPRNLRRIVRALEVHHATGRRFSEFTRRQPPFEWLAIGIDIPREDLYRRIDARVEAMFRQGLLGEAAILQRTYADTPALSAIGYREAIAHLCGEMSLPEAIRRTQYATHRLARTQANWFRMDDARIHWVKPDALPGAAIELCRGFLGEEPPT